MTTGTPAVRAIAPDLARGLMLLLIALANMPWHLYSGETGVTSGHHLDGDGLDRLWQAIAVIAVDGRSYPLFAFLFGYGIWQLYRRQHAAGVDPSQARRLLQRRHWWMLAFGAVHAALLWMGDIVGAYGLLGLIVVWLFLDRRDRTLAIWAGGLAAMLLSGSLVTIGLGFFVTALDVASTPIEVPNPAAEASYLASIGARLAFWAPALVGQAIFGLTIPVAVLLAIIAARRGILEQPEQHLRLLRAVAIGGILTGWAGGVLPLLTLYGVLDVEFWTFLQLHSVTGLAGGLGYAAAFALIGARVRHRGQGRVSWALAAVGKRSLTCYLAQSVLFAPVLNAWGLGLGGVFTEWQGALYAVGVWLVTLILACALEAAGKRGPAEWLLRKLAYRKSIAQPTPVSASSTLAA